MSTLGWTLEVVAGIALVVLLVVRAQRFRARRPRRVVVVRTASHMELWLRRDRTQTLQGRVSRANPLVSGLAYTDGFHLFPPPAEGRILFIGAGPGIAPRQVLALHPGVTVTVVESEPEVLAVAARSFHLAPGPRLSLEVDDGRELLSRQAPRTFDLIVVDAFDAGTYPGRLCTVEFFAMCRDRLREPGTLVVNLGGTLAPGPASRSRLPSVLAGIAEVFGPDRTRAFGVPLGDAFDPSRLGNTLAFGFRGDVPAPADGSPDILPALPSIRRCPVPVPQGAQPLHDADVPEHLEIA